jgi:hypothetical protein
MCGNLDACAAAAAAACSRMMMHFSKEIESIDAARYGNKIDKRQIGSTVLLLVLNFFKPLKC